LLLFLIKNFPHKRQWVGPGEKPSPDPKSDPHRKKLMWCVVGFGRSDLLGVIDSRKFVKDAKKVRFASGFEWRFCENLTAPCFPLF
jgi:hypothetical protein